jgi:hypothetical protein
MQIDPDTLEYFGLGLRGGFLFGPGPDACDTREDLE